MSYLHIQKHKLITFGVSVFLSFFLVVLMAGAITYIDLDSVGVATATPGAAVSVKGQGIFEGFVSADYFTSTSTATSWLLGGNLGLGTTTPGGKLDVRGAGLFDGFVHANYFKSTSTNPSWIFGNLGLGTTTPGTFLGVKGAGLFEGFVWVDYMVATSTGTASGFGTTSPGAEFAVGGGALFEGGITASYLNATSTTATSTVSEFGLQASTTLIMDGMTGRVSLGATTTPDGDVANVPSSLDPSLSIFGMGNANNATGTLYIGNNAGGGGGAILLKSADGSGCISIMATRGSNAIDSTATLTVRVAACPK